QVVTESGPLPPPALARVACGLADALAAVHAAGVVHRDLKPSNVMLLDELPVVIDFGIAQGPDATRLTLTGMFMGTPGYLAVELATGGGVVRGAAPRRGAGGDGGPAPPRVARRARVPRPRPVPRPRRPAVRVRRLRGDLLPHRERAARPHRGPGVPAAAADRR